MTASALRAINGGGIASADATRPSALAIASDTGEWSGHGSGRLHRDPYVPSGTPRYALNRHFDPGATARVSRPAFSGCAGAPTAHE